MQARTFRPVLLTAAAVALGGCIDMDTQTVLKADGSGTMSMKVGFTEGFVKILQQMQEIDPEEDILESAREVYFDEPNEEARAAMKEAGCELLEFEGERSETKIFSRFKVAFAHLGALSELDRMQPADEDGKKSSSGPGDGMTLVKNDDGTYTLAMSGNDDDEDGDLSEDEIDEIVEGAEEGEDETPEDPEAEAAKAMKAMELMGAMMAEMGKLKINVAMEVPGEIVSFTPASVGKQDGQKVSWTLDMSTMMSGAMGEGGMDDGFSVTFRMPEGESMPESALTKKGE